MANIEQDQYIQQILEGGTGYDDLLHRPLLRATRQLAEGAPVSANLRTQIQDEIVAHWLRPPFWQLRPEIGSILRDNAGSTFVLEVLDRLLVESLEIGEGTEAAILAGQAGRKEEAAELLLSSSYGEIAYVGDDEDNLEAAVAYSKIGDRETAAARLLEIASDIQYADPLCCPSALQALEEMGDCSPAIIDGLRTSLQEVPEPRMRINLALTLVHFDQAQMAVPSLHEIVNDPSIEDGVRRSAATALAKAGDRDFAITALLALMYDESTHKAVACWAARDLARIGEHETGVNFLIEAAQIGKPCIMCDGVACSCGRNYIMETLANLGEREAAISLLASYLKHDGFRLLSRVDFAAQLAKLGEFELANPVLLGALQLSDTDQYARHKAIEALALAGQKNECALEALLCTALDENLDWYPRHRAITGLGDFGNADPAVLEKLAEITRTSSQSSLSRGAREALWKLTSQ